MRSDIRKGDIIVWGLTNIERVEISKDWNFTPQPISLYKEAKKKYYTLDYFDSETITLKSIRSVLQVINFCQKIGAELYLANLLDITWIPVACKDYKNYIDLTENLSITDRIRFLDVGTDNEHPGPKQHQKYAEKLFNLIEGNKHGKTV